MAVGEIDIPSVEAGGLCSIGHVLVYFSFSWNMHRGLSYVVGAVLNLL